MTRRHDFSAHVREHRSSVVRALLIFLGTVLLVIGLIGLFLPVVPTTPFILLAAACYARGSSRFYHWLVGNRLFGPIVIEWHEHHCIPWRIKLFAIGMMSVSFAISIVFFVRPLWLQGTLALVGVALALLLYRIPSRDRPGARVVVVTESIKDREQ